MSLITFAKVVVFQIPAKFLGAFFRKKGNFPQFFLQVKIFNTILQSLSLQNEGLNGGLLARVYNICFYIIYYIYIVYYYIYIIVNCSSCIYIYIQQLLLQLYIAYFRALFHNSGILCAIRMHITSSYLALGGVPEALFADIRPFCTYIHVYTRSAPCIYRQSSPFHPRYPAPPYSRQPPVTCLLSNFFYFLFFSWVPYVLVYDVDDST